MQIAVGGLSPATFLACLVLLLVGLPRQGGYLTLMSFPVGVGDTFGAQSMVGFLRKLERQGGLLGIRRRHARGAQGITQPGSSHVQPAFHDRLEDAQWKIVLSVRRHRA